MPFRRCYLFLDPPTTALLLVPSPLFCLRRDWLYSASWMKPAGESTRLFCWKMYQSLKSSVIQFAITSSVPVIRHQTRSGQCLYQRFGSSYFTIQYWPQWYHVILSLIQILQSISLIPTSDYGEECAFFSQVWILRPKSLRQNTNYSSYGQGYTRLHQLFPKHCTTANFKRPCPRGHINTPLSTSFSSSWCMGTLCHLIMHKWLPTNTQFM